MEQLGRKKKDKKLADLTTSFLPSFQNLKPGACLSAWENLALHVALISMGRVAASCGARVIDSGSSPSSMYSEAGVAREDFSG